MGAPRTEIQRYVLMVNGVRGSTRLLWLKGWELSYLPRITFTYYVKLKDFREGKL